MTKHCWNVLRTSGPFEHRTGVLFAGGGRTFAPGDVLTLPPDTDTRWIVVEVQEVLHDPSRGILTVDALP